MRLLGIIRYAKDKSRFKPLFKGHQPDCTVDLTYMLRLQPLEKIPRATCFSSTFSMLSVELLGSGVAHMLLLPSTNKLTCTFAKAVTQGLR